MANAKQKKILVVEDELLMRDLVVRKLNTGNFDVKIAADGKEAMEIWQKEYPDLVLLDLIMPEMDGFEVLKKIRDMKDQKLANTAVIILSNLWSNKDILRAQNLHIQGYLVKSYFTPEDILQKVQEILAKIDRGEPLPAPDVQ